MAELLTEAELRLAGVPELHAQIAALEQEMGLARRDAEVARREAADLDRALLYGRRLLRHVRPGIQLLRKVRRRLRSGLMPSALDGRAAGAGWPTCRDGST